MNDRTPPPTRVKGPPPAPRDAAHEARRAEALRVNLRRRKATAGSVATGER